LQAPSPNSSNAAAAGAASNLAIEPVLVILMGFAPS
jgi:hypothetical protein